MKTKTTIHLLAALLATSAAWAGTHLNLTSVQPVQIWINGEFAGQTPAKIELTEPGKYQLQAEEMGTGRYQVFDVEARKAVTSRQSWTIVFDAPTRYREVVTTQRVVVAPILTAGVRHAPPALMVPSGPPPVTVIRRPPVVFRPVIHVGPGRPRRHWRRW